MLDGALVIDKPPGLTSHDVVAAARRILGQTRIGHTGTLDPFATGVLVLLLGRATRLSRFLTAAPKHYVAGVCLGQATDTYDVTGRPVGPAARAEAVDAVDRRRVEAALAAYRGRIEQAPPPFSAKKVDGVRAYALARRGEAAQPASVTVTVHALRVVSLTGGLATIEIACSAGFYVRVLAHDLGRTLSVGAHVAHLRRTASGELTIEQALSLAALQAGGAEAAAGALVPIDALLSDCPGVRLTETGAARVRHGRTIGAGEILGWVATTRPAAGADPSVNGEGRPIRLLGPDGRLLALATAGSPRAPLLHPSVVLV